MATSRHHLWYPRRSYATPTEKTFRSLQCNIVVIDAEVHRLIHATYEPPIKPTYEEMRVAIERHRHHECGCYEKS